MTKQYFINIPKGIEKDLERFANHIKKGDFRDNADFENIAWGLACYLAYATGKMDNQDAPPEQN